MQTKLFEVRDRATFIPVLAVDLSSDNDAQAWLMRKAGYGSRNIMLTNLNGDRPASADIYFWGDRTMSNAHAYITEHFDNLEDGDVIDVEFILGETTVKKISERFPDAKES